MHGRMVVMAVAMVHKKYLDNGKEEGKGLRINYNKYLSKKSQT